MQTEGGIPLQMSISTKEQKYIRASIHTPTKTAGATIVFNGKKVVILEKVTQESTSRLLSGEEAAANLFDLIALNPDYHYSASNGFDFKIPVFEGYYIELQREVEPIRETNRYMPTKMILHEVGESGNTLIRSIKYLSFFDEIDPYLQPKEIVFTDESNGETGRITIQKIEYNVGLPDFLFEIDDAPN
jgi:outer membrane lipoprotein-sorting protein